MRRVLFFILVLMTSTVFAQTSQREDAYKVFEYKAISNKLLGEKIISFCDEVDRTRWIGWIINYGTIKTINRREKQIKSTRVCVKEFPSPRIQFLRIEKEDNSRTEFWVVPSGEEPPPIKKK